MKLKKILIFFYSFSFFISSLGLSNNLMAQGHPLDCVSYGSALLEFQEKFNFHQQLVTRILTSIDFYSKIKNRPTIMRGYAKNYLRIRQPEETLINHSQLQAAVKLLGDQINKVMKRQEEFEKIQSQLTKIEDKWQRAKNFFRDSCVHTNQLGVYTQILNTEKTIKLGCYEDLWWQLQKDIDFRNKQSIIAIETKERNEIGDFSMKGLFFTWDKGDYQLSLDDQILDTNKASFLKQCLNPEVRIDKDLPSILSYLRYKF